MVLYTIIFAVLIAFSAFFSSAETALLSINKIKLNLNAEKKNKKALLIKNVLKDPEEFFSTILIGNNFVNIAAASISTVLIERLLTVNQDIGLLISTLITTTIVLIFAEIVPKTYAFRYSEKLSYSYSYPIKFFNYMFYPLVKITSFFSSLMIKESSAASEKRGHTTEEVKHFLSSETKLSRYNPDSIRMINEILDIAEKNIKSIMTPRMNVIALQEDSEISELTNLMIKKKLSKVPIYKHRLDNITGIIHTGKIMPALLAGEMENMRLKDLASKPIFISEYSSINYAVKQFKQHGLNMAVVVDEYGTAIGILTLNDIFREILGEIRVEDDTIRKTAQNRFFLKGSLPVEEVNGKLNVHLPEKKDYATLSGLFIYFYGKFPKENCKIKIDDMVLIVKKMGKRRIEELLLIRE